MGREGHYPLFETKRARGRLIYRLFSVSIFVGICLIWVYRLNHIPKHGEDGRWVWIGLLGSELWFGFYWLLTQALRWSRTYRFTFKDRLSQRYFLSLSEVLSLFMYSFFLCTNSIYKLELMKGRQKLNYIL